MRTLLLAGAAAISLVTLTGSANAQQTADELNRQSAPAPMNTTVIRSADPGMPDAVVTNLPGNMVSVPPADMHKTYPVCTARLQDSCQNPGEGGAR